MVCRDLRTSGAIFAAFVLLWPLVANGQSNREDVTPRQVTMRAEGARAAINIGEATAYLGREKLLDVRVFVNDESVDIRTVLTKKGLVTRWPLAESLERYLCSLNSHVCGVGWKEKTARANWRLELAPPDAAVEGMACDYETKGPTRIPDLPPFALCLPDVLMREYVTSRVVPYDARRDDLAQIVTNQTGGCRSFDQACRNDIRNLNGVRAPTSAQADPFSRTFRGSIRLPVSGQSATVPVNTAAHFSALTQSLDILTSNPWRIGDKSFEQGRLYYTVPAPARAQSHAGPWTWPDPVREYMTVLNVMGYPYQSFARFSNIQPITIGVWDTRVDDEHCEFVDASGRAVVVPEPTTPLLSADSATNAPRKLGGSCGDQRQFGRKVFDHGTHVAGILAARVNGHGIAGVNPRAELWTYELQFGTRLATDPDPITRVKTKRSMNMPLVNISLDFSSTNPSTTQLAAIIHNFRKEVLFVAAAGNDGLRTDGIQNCTVIPACWSTLTGQPGAISGENIVSVIALNQTGTALLPDPNNPSKPGTNYGRSFDVAAVGVVMSTLHGNYVGTMGGSSVATPYVTGLASLIYGTAPSSEISPRAVKERILATVDLSTTFDDAVRFGRINFSRALEFTKDLILMKATACGRAVAECNPTNVRVRKSETTLITVTEGKLEDDELDAPITIRAKDIRRIKAESDTETSRYWIIYARDGRLEVLRGARIDNNSALFYEVPRDVRLDVNKILDYTPCAFAKGCAR